MSPQAERSLERLVALLERLLDRRFLEEHEQIKLELVQLRGDVNHQIEFTEKLEDANESTKDIYVDDLKKKLKDREDSGDKWVRYVVASFVALLFMGISTFLGWLARGGGH